MTDDGAQFETPRLKARLGVVIINYRTAALVKDCLVSLAPELEAVDARVVVVDNASGDGSADAIAGFITAEDEPWKARVALVRSRVNTGFSGGNNIGMACLDADFLLLLNSDAVVRPGALGALLASAGAHPRAGVIGPRLEDPDGTPQVSAFRAITPLSEFLRTLRLGALDRLLAFAVVARPPSDRAGEVAWVSFACALVRREALEAAGPMDDGYFMYFEDPDYCFAVRKAGWTIVHDPSARVVHLGGGSSPAHDAVRLKKRPPAYYYASRTRYFRKRFGPLGPYAANLAWLAGRALTHLRLLAGGRPPPVCEHEARDIWTNWRDPLGDRRAPVGPRQA